LRELTRELLLDGGYAVIQAASGTEALRVSRSHRGRIDLLLTDVLMPGMDGPELVDRFAALRPETKALLMSGYSAEALICSGVRAGEMRFLAKPFSVDELEREVRASIDGDLIEQQEA
jgi:two-component system, cell cycle sensor histidine kinase and response regulator CckA